jgi:hypothetical protein
MIPFNDGDFPVRKLFVYQRISLCQVKTVVGLVFEAVEGITWYHGFSAL